MGVKGRSINSILLTLIILPCFLVGGNMFQSPVAQSSDENLSRPLDRQDPISPVPEDSRKRLNSQGKMLGVTLHRTSVYDATGVTEPKAILWKTKKLVTIRLSEFSTTQVGSITVFSEWSTENYTSMLTAVGEELYFTTAANGDGRLFVIDRRTGEAKTLRLKETGALSQPVVAGDFLYVGSADSSFRAFDRRTGELKWRIGRKDYRYYYTAPAVADGVIFFDGNDVLGRSGGLQAVDALTGDSKWTFDMKGSGPVAVADGAIYFGAGDRNLHAVSAETGREIWRFESPDYVRTPMIMNGRVFFSDRSSNLFAVDLKSGKEIWRVAMKNRMATGLAAYRGALYFGGRYSNLFALDADTGKVKWDYSTTKPCLRPIVANGTVYTAVDNIIFAIDAETGKEKWRYKVKSSLYTPPLIGDGVIYFMDEDGSISALG
jgi:outer membrane protein assembly factor BamB